MHYYKREWPLAGSRGQGEGLSTLSIMDGSVSGAADESWGWMLRRRRTCKQFESAYYSWYWLLAIFINLTLIDINYKGDLYCTTLQFSLVIVMQHKHKAGQCQTNPRPAVSDWPWCRNADARLTQMTTGKMPMLDFLTAFRLYLIAAKVSWLFFLIAVLISWKNFQNPRVLRP